MILCYIQRGDSQVILQMGKQSPEPKTTQRAIGLYKARLPRPASSSSTPFLIAEQTVTISKFPELLSNPRIYVFKALIFCCCFCSNFSSFCFDFSFLVKSWPSSPMASIRFLCWGMAPLICSPLRFLLPAFPLRPATHWRTILACCLLHPFKLFLFLGAGFLQGCPSQLMKSLQPKALLPIVPILLGAGGGGWWQRGRQPCLDALRSQAEALLVQLWQVLELTGTWFCDNWPYPLIPHTVSPEGSTFSSPMGGALPRRSSLSLNCSMIITL